MADFQWYPKGYDVLQTSDEVCELLEEVGGLFAGKANKEANPKRGDTPYKSTRAYTDNTHKAVVFVDTTDNHGFWDNEKHHTLNKIRTGGELI